MFAKGIKDLFLFFIRLPKFIYILWKMSRLKGPIITVFGGKKLAQNGLAIITGGGPGIMEAALYAAIHAKGKDFGLGINVYGIDVDFVPECGKHSVYIGDFSVRKWLLTRYARGFIIFPGGYGTMDELLEVLNLIKVGKMKQMPIVLIGKDYWQGWQTWVDNAVDYGCILQKYKDLFVITDDIEYALETIKQNIINN